jgi:hypothetical protein
LENVLPGLSFPDQSPDKRAEVSLMGEKKRQKFIVLRHGESGPVKCPPASSGEFRKTDRNL